MKPINEAHVAEPGLAVVEVAAADDETGFAVQELLAARCAIAPADATPVAQSRSAGGPGHYPLTSRGRGHGRGQKDLRTLAASIRAGAEGRYVDAEPG
ncbi:hypothetical protein QFZ55_008184 [Streptomyces luteogriseus]|uniref:DUF6207 family protein n=1 Tax=Streptomyces luteogriseus TaxID=68233 RepID=UPI0027884BD2|nr:DUF6207 family protein [Streptomyces luteogriseus]MDQ0710556.1 hypothetical protein [Streptomyces luteogriseus]MDQ0718732.1 hypothetical protein [Streptomyces luteogriseus]